MEAKPTILKKIRNTKIIKASIKYILSTERISDPLM